MFLLHCNYNNLKYSQDFYRKFRQIYLRLATIRERLISSLDLYDFYVTGVPKRSTPLRGDILEKLFIEFIENSINSEEESLT